MKRSILLGLLIILTAVVAGAQERNMARLVLEDTTFVEVSLGMKGEAGRMKDIFEAEQQVCGVLDASSRRRLGAASLCGHFGYGYDYGRGSTWRGWIDPYETPFMLADSIPGSLSLERYSMQAGIGFPIGGRWSAGVDLAYDVALMAKHKDLRNKNTLMDFRVAPGIHWQGGRLGLGLDAGYERVTERVEYSQESSNLEQVLFDIYGLWICHSSGFASAETRRFKEGHRLYGDFQLDLRLDGAVLHNNLRGSWMQSNQSEVGYNNQQFGTTRSWTWEDDLSLEIGSAHQVDVYAAFSTMQGLRPLQRQELDPDSRIRIWVTCGDPVFCYWRQYHFERLAYTFGTSWKLTVGAENWKTRHSYTEYPQRFTQQIGTITPFAGLMLPVGRQIELSASVGYAKDYDPESDISSWQLARPMLLQWEYWEGNSWLAGAGLRWNAPSGRMYVSGRYDLEVSTEPPTDIGGSRHTASLTLGWVF